MVTVGDKIIVVFGRELILQSSHTRILFCCDVGLINCSFLSKFTYSKNLKTGTTHLKCSEANDRESGLQGVDMAANNAGHNRSCGDWKCHDLLHEGLTLTKWHFVQV